MENKKQRLWSGDFVLVLAIALLSCVTCQGLNNGTPIYVAYAGGSNAFAGALVLEFSLAAAMARIVVGRVIDDGSRRLYMALGAVLLLAGTVGAVVLPYLQLQVVFRAVQGAGFGAIMTAGSTAAADIAPAERLGEALGYFGLGQSLGMAVGPSLAIVLMSFSWHESLFAGMAALSACLIALSLASSYEKHPERLAETAAFRTDVRTSRERTRFTWSNLFEKGALPGAVPMAVVCLGYAIIVTYVSKYGVDNGLANPGVFFVCAAITMTAVRLFGGTLIDRTAPLALLTVPVACGIACFALLAFTSAEVPFYIAGALFGLSMGLSFPLFNTVAVKCAPIERRGAASAMYGLANDVGIGVGAVIWGAVIDSVGYTVSFWGGAAMLALTLVVAALVFPRNGS
ncbi:MAG: MFS transporter [Eggerthellaceae bacterium]|nr:MFS transporter [Eggerthellaceae bacterium]